MIVYEATKKEFCQAVFDQTIVDEIYAMFQEKLGRKTSEAEIRSWENSMEFMDKILDDSEIPDDSSVAIEFTIPLTSRRIDFMIAGEDAQYEDSIIIIELKQWEKAQKVDGKDAIVKTYLGGGIRETTHPSYQAWSYACLLKDFNETVEDENLPLYPCAYLHNYHFTDNDPLKDEKYEKYYEEAPLYGKGDRRALRDFIKKYIKYGDDTDILCRIDHGKIKPSKKLQDSLYSMLHGNKEFLMIDEQKTTYETALQMASMTKEDGKKRVLIVEGGPGTGKSVLAINLLVDILNDDMITMYVTKNSAPRNVFCEKLIGGDYSKTYIKNLFKSSGTFTQTEENQFDVLIVDEAHRLNEKSGFFGNLGENQVKEIINSAKFSIFFIDKHQKIAFNDYGSIEAIEYFANEVDAEIVRCKLDAQFRCNGSDAYLSWLDHVLEIKDTANYDGFDFDYDFRVIDDVCELRDLIFAKNEEIDDEKIDKTYDARLLAGYCWNWDKDGRSDTNYHDIVIGDFAMSWNLNNSDTYAIDETSINEVGCIHTSQGLEFDYVGVIIGNDMRYEEGHIVTDFNQRAKTDQSLKGIKTFYNQNPKEALEIADEIIKNTYRTLMTRGMKGCYIYCNDMELQTYFKERITNHVYDKS